MADVQMPQPLGPEGIQRRIQEIQAKMASVFGTKSSAPATGGTAGTADFNGVLKPFDINSPGVAIKGGQATPQIKALIDAAARQHNVDPDLFDALVNAESSYDPSARSRAGALGLSQLMPDTARGLGVTNPFDPADNLNGGAKYLRSLLDKFGDIPTALAAYNAGPGSIEKYGGIPPYTETKVYVSKIMASYNARKPQ